MGCALSGRVALQVRYDEALSHKVEAGSDIFLMPSRYEPGGLNQLYSLRYGTVPVVRATGGLDDTIDEWNAEQRTGTGFNFTATRRRIFSPPSTGRWLSSRTNSRGSG